MVPHHSYRATRRASKRTAVRLLRLRPPRPPLRPGAGFAAIPSPVLPCPGKATWTRRDAVANGPATAGDHAAAHSDHGLFAGSADGGVAVARRRASTMSRSAALESPRGQARRLNRPQLSDR